VFFAAERTFLARIRTGLALMGFGFVVARFGLFLREMAVMQGGPPPRAGVSRWFGIGLIGLGMLLTAASTATLRFLRTVWSPARKIYRSISSSPTFARSPDARQDG
jgi:putative membrane protein